MRANLDKVLTEALKIINSPTASNVDKEIYAAIVADISRTLNVIDDPNTSAEDKATYTKFLAGITGALQIAQDPKKSANDRAVYRDIADDLAIWVTVMQSPETKPADKAYYKARVELLSDALAKLAKGEVKKPEQQKKIETGVKKTLDALKAIQNPNTKPENPQDQDSIKQVVERNSEALVTAQNPDASEQERNDAQATVDQLAGASQNSQFQELMEEVKRLGAPSACVEAIESRTNEAGWPDGSLWGLSDPSCANTVAAGANEGGKWSALFECVQNGPFSECVGTLPKE